MKILCSSGKHTFCTFCRLLLYLYMKTTRWFMCRRIKLNKCPYQVVTYDVIMTGYGFNFIAFTFTCFLFIFIVNFDICDLLRTEVTITSSTTFVPF